ncbi:MAG: hypothetical protein D6791_11980 [Chloroflexi bacterium]|nr:MAG: hypothetical protein D6791_11980 [Chloroflexota bacterium]
MCVNDESHALLPMVRYLTTQPVEVVIRFYDQQRDYPWRGDTLLGQPVFYRADDAPEGQDARTALMSKPGSQPSISLAPTDEWDQAILKGVQTMMEIVYQK